MLPARILVVDDTVEVRSLVGRILIGQGYRVVEASDGTQALAACHRLRGAIDLLLTDVKMPGMDGLELADSIIGSYPEVRVLLVSGQCEESEIQHHVSEKHFGFLSKPFMPQLLIETVESILRPGKRPPHVAGPDEISDQKKTG